MPKITYFDNDTRPVSPDQPIPSEKIRPQARRRRYSHTFSAGRQLKKIINSKGQPKWRRIPDGALVHYGKQDSVRAKPGSNPLKRVWAKKAPRRDMAPGREPNE